MERNRPPLSEISGSAPDSDNKNILILSYLMRAVIVIDCLLLSLRTKIDIAIFSESTDRTKTAASTLSSTAMSVRNDSSSLGKLWTGLRGLVRTGWTLLLSDELLRNFYLSLYNDAADPTRRPVATPGESTLNDQASGERNCSVLAVHIYYDLPSRN